MREIGFLVADKNMEACIRGLFSRSRWHQALGCRAFEVDCGPGGDIRVAAGQHDPGLFTRADALLRPFRGKYRRMVVMIDAAWEGSPGSERIRERMTAHLATAGWEKQDGLALVLEPEIEVWLWTRTDHTARALGWPSWAALSDAFAQTRWWPAGAPKPLRPKEATEWALTQRSTPRSSRIYEEVTRNVGVQRCSDPAFGQLRDALSAWFPVDEEA